MGRQVNFYLTPADTKALEEQLRNASDLLVLQDRTPSPEPNIIESVAASTGGLRSYLCLREDVGAVSMQFIERQGYWLIDGTTSPVVEFDRCFFDDKVLRRGRVYFQPGFYDRDGVWRDKPERFVKWADAILRATRRALIRGETFIYLGADAKAWASRGGDLSQF